MPTSNFIATQIGLNIFSLSFISHFVFGADATEMNRANSNSSLISGQSPAGASKTVYICKFCGRIFAKQHKIREHGKSAHGKPAFITEHVKQLPATK